MRKDKHAFDVFSLKQQLAQIKFNEINEKSYDGDTKKQLLIDEVGQWEQLRKYPLTKDDCI